MTHFRFDSAFFKNIYSISQQEITNKICTIHINSRQEIKIPLLIAVSFSSVISQMLQIDPLMTDFYIRDEFLGDINTNIINKLIESLNLNEVQLENEEIAQFAALGKAFGSTELLLPYQRILKEYEQNINKENIFWIIKQKVNFSPNEKIDSEISYIVSHFSELTDKLIELGKEIKYYHVIESIVTSENIKLASEDEMLFFVIKLCQHNNIYELLFEHVWLEYCSIEPIIEFIDYINKHICKDNHLISIHKCINRRLIQEHVPLKIINYQRYDIENYKYVDNNPLNGILRQEYLKDNVEMRTSSTDNGDVYDLLKNDTYYYFYTKNEPNSWIEGNLKNHKPFTITHYVIRGMNFNKYNSQLRTWKVEGRRITDGKWIELDKHENEPFNCLAIRAFPIYSHEKFDTVRLTQTGTSTSGHNNLFISAFDIYGNKYNLL